MHLTSNNWLIKDLVSFLLVLLTAQRPDVDVLPICIPYWYIPLPSIERIRPPFELTARDAIGGDASRGIQGAKLLPRLSIYGSGIS